MSFFSFSPHILTTASEKADRMLVGCIGARSLRGFILIRGWRVRGVWDGWQIGNRTMDGWIGWWVLNSGGLGIRQWIWRFWGFHYSSFVTKLCLALPRWLAWFMKIEGGVWLCSWHARAGEFSFKVSL